LTGKFLLVLASTVVIDTKRGGTHDHILLPRAMVTDFWNINACSSPTSNTASGGEKECGHPLRKLIKFGPTFSQLRDGITDKLHLFNYLDNNKISEKKTRFGDKGCVNGSLKLLSKIFSTPVNI
jgi:hypothetical protein